MNAFDHSPSRAQQQSEGSRQGPPERRFAGKFFRPSFPPQTDSHDPHNLAAAIMHEARHVRIDTARLTEVVGMLRAQPITIPKWDFSPIYPAHGSTEELARYFLVLNAINYCYFHEAASPYAGRRFAAGAFQGADACAAALTRQFERTINPYYLALSNRITLAEEVFLGSIPMPLLGERAQDMREVGVFIGDLEMAGLGVIDFMKRLDGDAFEISKALPHKLPGFRDPFLKRAQLFVAMFYGRCRDNPDCPIAPKSLRKLSLFADYRVPQAFIGMGAIVPDESLESTLERELEIPEGTPMEQELRAASVVVGKLMLEAMNRCGETPLNALHLDYLAWKAARDAEKGKALPGLFLRPLPKHHRTISTKY